MVDAEYDSSHNNNIKRLIKNAKFSDSSAFLGNIDYLPDRNLNRDLLESLADNSYIRQGLNVILIGATGSGKSFIANALGVNACQPDIHREMLAGLPQEVEEYVVPAGETCSVCGGKLKVVGKRVVRTEVEYQPAKLILKQIVQQVAKCMECGEEGSRNENSHFQKAAVPAPPLGHSLSTPSLIA